MAERKGIGGRLERALGGLRRRAAPSPAAASETSGRAGAARAKVAKKGAAKAATAAPATRVSTATAKPAAKAPPKTTAKSAAKPRAQSTAKSTAKSAVKSTAKPAAVKSTAKRAAAPAAASKSTSAASKPATKAAAKRPAKPPAKQSAKRPATSSDQRPARAAKRAAAEGSAQPAGQPRPESSRADPGTEQASGGGRDPQEFAEIRTSLVARAEDLRAEYDRAMLDLSSLQRDRMGDVAGDDQADAGSKAFEREQEMSLAGSILDRLKQVEHALERLQAGTYGQCERCGNPIPRARLEAFPSVTLCVTCKQREERR